MTAIFMTPGEMTTHLAKRAQEKRLALNLTQKSLSSRSGVSLGTIKKFERSGRISLESLLKLALVLESLTEFYELFKPIEEFASLDELINQKIRKRGRG